jgi:uncharacterized protein involved in type VI secretion and phage assembly
MIDDDGAKRFYGKYRASVHSNADPNGRGRLELLIPDVLGDKPSTWAEACVPLAGPPGTAMGAYLVPPEGTAVWVEFEAGDSNHPVWVGCIWSGERNDGVPSRGYESSRLSPSIVIQTLGQNRLVISDAPGAAGGITLQAASGARISVTDEGIVIETAKGAVISLTGDTVDINRDALTIK